MEQVLRYLKGYVRIRLISRQPQRFLKLCAFHKIQLYHLCCREGIYEMEISLKDFYSLQTICRKSHSHVHIQSKIGWPFFFYRSKKRKGFFAGMICCLLLLFFCTTRLWNIHVEGNSACSTETILDYLESENIVHGISLNSLNCSQIAASLRQHFSNFTWVSAKIKGTRLLITVQENTDTSYEEEKEGSSWDLVAEKEGVIVHMVTRQGVPQVQVGDLCQKGQILVSGRLEIQNDDQEVVKYEYVGADADVYIQYQMNYHEEIPMEIEKRVYTGREKRKLCLQILGFQIILGLPCKNYSEFDVVTHLSSVKLTENYFLPLYWGIIEEREYDLETSRYTQKQAENLANSKLTKFIYKLAEKGVKISANNVKITIVGDVCVSSGTVTVIEKIGTQTPVEVLEEPEERTVADEQ